MCRIWSWIIYFEQGCGINLAAWSKHMQHNTYLWSHWHCSERWLLVVYDRCGSIPFFCSSNLIYVMSDVFLSSYHVLITIIPPIASMLSSFFHVQKGVIMCWYMLLSQIILSQSENSCRIRHYSLGMDFSSEDFRTSGRNIRRSSLGSGRSFWDFTVKKWRFPSMGVPQNGWFIMHNPVTVIWNGWFRGTPIFGHLRMGIVCSVLSRI